MVQISISHNFPEVQRQINRLQEDISRRALASAVNKTMDRAKTEMRRSIISEFAVKSSYVQERLAVRGAKFTNGTVELQAELSVKGKRGRSSNVIAFARKVTLSQAKRMVSQARRTQKKSNTQRELQYQFKRGGGSKTIPGSFVGNKGRTIFIRQGKARLPIEPVQVIDVPQMFNTKKINLQVRQFIATKFPEVFAREADFFTKKFSSR